MRLGIISVLFITGLSMPRIVYTHCRQSALSTYCLKMERKRKGKSERKDEQTA